MDATTGELLEPSLDGCPEVYAVALHPEGRHLATACPDWIAGVGTVRVWDLETGQPVWEQEVHEPGIVDVAYSPDGRWLASAVADEGHPEVRGAVKIWEAETGREIRRFERHTAGVFGVSFSPDSRWLASACGDGIVRIWDIKDPDSKARELRGHAGGVKRVVFLPDGRLASVGDPGDVGISPRFGEVKIWDLTTGRALNLRGHTDAVGALACSPDGQRLATGSDDRTIKLWDTRTGEEVLTLRGHTTGVICVAFSPDGRRLASGAWDWIVRVWDTGPPVPKTLLQRGADPRAKVLELPADPFAR